jgi:hypothetical protein
MPLVRFELGRAAVIQTCSVSEQSNCNSNDAYDHRGDRSPKGPLHVTASTHPLNDWVTFCVMYWKSLSRRCPSSAVIFVCCATHLA